MSFGGDYISSSFSWQFVRGYPTPRVIELTSLPFSLNRFFFAHPFQRLQGLVSLFIHFLKQGTHSWNEVISKFVLASLSFSDSTQSLGESFGGNNSALWRTSFAKWLFAVVKTLVGVFVGWNYINKHSATLFKQNDELILSIHP